MFCVENGVGRLYNINDKAVLIYEKLSAVFYNKKAGKINYKPG